MKTRTKTFIFISIIISIGITFSFGILSYLLPIVYEKDKRENAIQSAHKVIAEINAKPIDKIKETINKEENSKGATIWVVRDSKEKIVYPTLSEEPAEMVIPTDNTEMVAIDAIIPVLDTTIKDSNGEKYNISVNMYSEPVREVKETLSKIYPYVLGLSFLVGGIGAYIYSHWATRRVHRIINRTKNMVVLEEPTDYVVKGKDEISELENNIQFLYLSLLENIQSLNQELEKSNAIEHSKSEFMRIASHELKTPITAMLGVIEGMILNVGRFKDRDYYLNVCKEILESQSQLVQDVLFISKLESPEKFETPSEEFSLTDLINETVALFELMSVQRGLAFDIKLKDVIINCNKEDMKRVLMNLLSNAVKYTKKNGVITITLTSINLVIENQCTPLEQEEIDKIFLPFYRPDYARARKDGGTGLGLYIISKLLLKNDIPFTFEPIANKTGMKFTLQYSKKVKLSE